MEELKRPRALGHKVPRPPYVRDSHSPELECYADECYAEHQTHFCRLCHEQLRLVSLDANTIKRECPNGGRWGVEPDYVPSFPMHVLIEMLPRVP